MHWIVESHTAEAVPVVRALFEEYAAGVGVDLCFQNFAAELAGLPGDYAPPSGRLYVVHVGEESSGGHSGEPAGCVALRKIDNEACEMKRLYVRPAYRGRGLGRALAIAIIEEARAIGYRVMRLDTLPSMRDAQAMYEELGFRDIPPYRKNPVPGTRYMQLSL